MTIANVKQLSAQLKTDVDNYTLITFDSGFRKHLGASAIGHRCWRKSWLTFRWAHLETFAPRMLRLFNRGHREESFAVSLLRGIGCTVWEHDPSTGKQWMFSAVGGHYGGSCDGQLQLPASYSYTGRMLFESKTNGTGKGFNDVASSGCESAKYEHFVQQSIYGEKFGNDYSIYYVVNKNDDDLHLEVVKLDHKLAQTMQDKAQTIILSKEPCKPISTNSATVDCKMCHYAGICHEGDLPTKNCRSCVNAEPRDGATWFCTRYGQMIPDDFMRKGCNDWTPIINRKV